jgi:hypothetical protein
MKRRWPKDVKYAQDGPNGRPAAEIAHRWVSAAKRRTHKRERQESKKETREQ